MTSMLKPNSIAFTVLLAGLAAMAPISTDIALPAYAATAEALGTSQAAVAVNLSLFMIGYALGPLLHGPLSERFGRRPVLIVGLIVFMACSVLCAVTPTLSVLLGSRLVQGFAASSASVLAFAIVRDLYEGMEARRKLSYVMLILGLMPMIAPTLGAFVLLGFGWRSVYVAMAGAGLVLLAAVIFGFGESIRARNPGALAPRQLIASYGAVIRHPTGFGYSALGALCFGVMFSFISGSSMLFMDVLGVSAATYGYLFAIPVIGMMAGTMVNGRMVGKGVSDSRTMAIGFIVMLSAVALLLVISLAGLLAVWPVVALLMVSNFGTGLILPNSSHRALQPMPHLAGFASAVLNSSQMAVGAISSAIVAALVPALGGSAMAISMALFAVCAASLFVWLVRFETRSARRAG
jgi:DHA1 family bicyclomycin/chloramphenicol resistance-like MFS transporter